MNTKNLLPIIVFLLSFQYEINSQTINRGPYLQLVTTSSIHVHWRTTTDTNSKVWYGDAPNNLISTLSVPGDREDHVINITGLSANTTYYYAVGNDSGQLAGGDNDHHFKTSPSTSSNETIKVLSGH